MTTIYALKDSSTGMYLTKHNTFQELSTTTRTFQTKEKAYKVARKESTYMWILVKKLTYGRRYARINISNENFKKRVRTILSNKPLQVVNVEMHSLLPYG